MGHPAPHTPLGYTASPTPVSRSQEASAVGKYLQLRPERPLEILQDAREGRWRRQGVQMLGPGGSFTHP